MIFFSFSIQNPWHNSKKFPWKDIKQGEVALTKNKTLEWGIDFHLWDLFEFQIDTAWRGQDHAGPKLNIRLFGLGFRIGVTDNRHWNTEANRWVNYDDPKEAEYWG